MRTQTLGAHIFRYPRHASRCHPTGKITGKDEKVRQHNSYIAPPEGLFCNTSYLHRSPNLSAAAKTAVYGGLRLHLIDREQCTAVSSRG